MFHSTPLAPFIFLLPHFTSKSIFFNVNSIICSKSLNLPPNFLECSLKYVPQRGVFIPTSRSYSYDFKDYKICSSTQSIRWGCMLSRETIVMYRGSIVRAQITEGLYRCPLCRNALFYTEKDLIAHIIGHAMGNLTRIKSISRT